MLGEAQTYFQSEADEREYALVPGAPGVKPLPGLPTLDKLQGPQVDLSTFGEQLEETVGMIDEAGLES